MENLIARILAFLASPAPGVLLEIKFHGTRVSMLVCCENRKFRYVYAGVTDGWTNDISEIMTDYAAFMSCVSLASIALRNKSGTITIHTARHPAPDAKAFPKLTPEARAILCRPRTDLSEA